MGGTLRDLLVLGLPASLGTPVAYLVYAEFLAIRDGTGLHVGALGSLLLVAFFVSLVATEVIALLTALIARVLRPRKINLILLALTFILSIALGAAWSYGTEQAITLLVLSVPNAVILLLVWRVRFGGTSIVG